jgi:hypothetical protein
VQGLFVVGAGERAPAVKSHLDAVTSMPIIFPEEPDWAVARGAALIAATAPRFEASTSGLAYAQDPDDEDSAGPDALTTGSMAPADVMTKHAVVEDIETFATRISDQPDAAPRGDRFLPVVSLAASVVVIGVVALVMALAVNNAPTSTQHVLEQRQVLPAEPTTSAPPLPPVVQAAPAANPLPEQARPTPVSPPATKTVLVEQAPRIVATQAPARKAETRAQPVAEARAPAVELPAAAPELPAAAPIVVDPPPVAEPVLVDPMPVAAPAPQIPIAPAPTVPPVAALLPRITMAPLAQAPAAAPQAPILRWLPRLQWPQLQTAPVSPPLQTSQTSQWPQEQTSLLPQQQISQWPQTSQSPIWPQQTSQWPQQNSLLQQTPLWPYH